MLHGIETVGGYVQGTVELPFFRGSASVLIGPEGDVTNEEIAFARRQIQLLATLPEETLLQLCRHTADYAADFVEYTGESLAMYGDDCLKEELIEPFVPHGDYSRIEDSLKRWFSPHDAAKIVRAVSAKTAGTALSGERLRYLVGEAVLDLGLQKHRYAHVLPTIRAELEQHPLYIMYFVRLQTIRFQTLRSTAGEVLAAELEFDCDWEPGHGLEWAIVDKTGVYVGAFEGLKLNSLNQTDYKSDYNYCFHKTTY